MFSNIKAILFDSGHTLNYPRTGNWFIPPNFHKHVEPGVFASVDPARLQQAIARARNLLDYHCVVSDEVDECRQFTGFYRALASEFPELEISDGAIAGLAEDTVYNDEKFVFYEDVVEMIPKFSRKYKLGIVSDTWPSLERVFTHAGLKNYFSSFVMSCALGVRKPHPLMYQTALSELGIEPREALFVDDSVTNVEGAKALGIHAVLILRSGRPDQDPGHLYVTNLAELEELLEEAGI